METFWFFQLRFRRAYDTAYDSDFRFSLGHKLSYDSDFDSDSDSVASENQPLETSPLYQRHPLLSVDRYPPLIPFIDPGSTLHQHLSWESISFCRLVQKLSWLLTDCSCANQVSTECWPCIDQDANQVLIEMLIEGIDQEWPFSHQRKNKSSPEDKQIIWHANWTNKFFNKQIVWYLAIWKDDFSKTICPSKQTS